MPRPPSTLTLPDASYATTDRFCCARQLALVHRSRHEYRMCAVGDAHAAMDSAIRASRRSAVLANPNEHAYVRTLPMASKSSRLQRRLKCPRSPAHALVALLRRARRLSAQRQPHRPLYYDGARRALPFSLPALHHAALLPQLALPDPALGRFLVHTRSTASFSMYHCSTDYCNHPLYLTISHCLISGNVPELMHCQENRWPT